MMCGPPPWDNNLTIAAATGTVRPPILRLRSAPPYERPSRNVQPGFSGDLRTGTIVYSILGAKDKISIYIKW
jgi:hypothetical protein